MKLGLINSAWAQAGITLAVNQNMRYDQSVRAAKTLLETGTLGEPVFATIDMRGIPHWMDWHRQLGWLTLRMMSIHHLDTLRYWFGEPDGLYCSVRTDPRTQFPHTDGICAYILDYANGLRCVGIDDTWTGPAREGCPADIRLQWRIEGTDGLAIGDIGWCKDPHTSPSTIRYATKGMPGFQSPVWPESWFPDAFIGTMAQLLVALENGKEPAISGRDNLKTMALVEAAYLSAASCKLIHPADAARSADLPVQGTPPRGFFNTRYPVQGSLNGAAPLPPSSAEPSIHNFTPRAQQALALARKEADRFNHNFIATEHLLLGLIALGQGVAVNVLQKMGLHLEAVRREVERQMGKGPEQNKTEKIPYTPRVKIVLALAAKEAGYLNHVYVGTEHLLLGLLREGGGVAARVLSSLNVDVDNARREILKELDPRGGETR